MQVLEFMARLEGFEPPAYGLEVRCYSKNYKSVYRDESRHK